VLDVDVLTPDGRIEQRSQEEERAAEEEPAGLFARMQERLVTDAQGPAQAEGQPPQNGGSQTQNDTAAGSPGTQGGAQNGQTGQDTEAASGENPGNSDDEQPAQSQGSAVTLQIRADTFVASIHYTDRWARHIPPSGVILPPSPFEISAGDTVYDVLRQAARSHGINISSRGTTFGVYIEGVNGLFEFDGGALSGWMYSVNDWFPNFGVANYVLSPGDMIELHYTTDLGRDLGQDWLG